MKVDDRLVIGVRVECRQSR